MPLQKRLDQASALLVRSSTFSNEPRGGRVLGSSKVVLAENKRSRLSLSATPPPALLPPPLLCLPYCSSGETSAPAGVVTAEVFWWERSMMGDVHRGMCVLGPRWPLSAALLPVPASVSCVLVLRSCSFLWYFAIRLLGIIILLHFSGLMPSWKARLSQSA